MTLIDWKTAQPSARSRPSAQVELEQLFIYAYFQGFKGPVNWPKILVIDLIWFLITQDWFDYPVQLAAYIHAFNADPMYTINVSGGLLVIAYSDGYPADAYSLDDRLLGISTEYLIVMLPWQLCLVLFHYAVDVLTRVCVPLPIFPEKSWNSFRTRLWMYRNQQLPKMFNRAENETCQILESLYMQQSTA